MDFLVALHVMVLVMQKTEMMIVRWLKVSPNFNFLLCWINEECPYWWRWRWFSKKWLLLQRMPVLKKCWWFQILWAPTAAIRKVWKSKQFPAEVCTGINIIIIAGEKMFLALMIVISYGYGHYGNDHFDDCYDRAMILPMYWNNV